MNILIENYRGFDIFFDSNDEIFACKIDNVKWGKKQSFASAKKFIDDYIKDNIVFEPFEAQHKENGNVIKVIGIRKDGRFIYDKNGSKEQLSDYDLKYYLVYNAANDVLFAEAASLDADRQLLYKKRLSVLEKVTGTHLSEMKNKYQSLIK